MYLGIDTSNYTTSLALVRDGVIIGESRRVLAVKAGERGLRQSEALYQHIAGLPELFDALSQQIDYAGKIKAVGVSEKPRPKQDSYMPVFRAGILAATALSKSLGVPMYRFSHQDNHIRAALFRKKSPDLGENKDRDIRYPFLAVHFSGGTSEIVLADGVNPAGYNSRIVCQTLDLNAGQLIDRVGVALGLAFPAGRELEALAKRAVNRDFKLSTALDGVNFHFSGQENAAKKAMADGIPAEEIAYAVFDNVARTLSRSIRRLKDITGARDAVFSGGVMANGIIRSVLEDKLFRSGIKLHFADAALATDHAVGVALLAQDVHQGVIV